MKSVFFLSIAVMMSGSVWATPKLVDVSFHKGYVPSGFDSNDNAQIVAEGSLSNTCYKPGPHQVMINHQEKTPGTFSPTKQDTRLLFLAHFCRLR